MATDPPTRPAARPSGRRGGTSAVRSSPRYTRPTDVRVLDLADVPEVPVSARVVGLVAVLHEVALVRGARLTERSDEHFGDARRDRLAPVFRDENEVYRELVHDVRADAVPLAGHWSVAFGAGFRPRLPG